MPCSDSSSSVVLRLDRDEKFLSFEYAKITCGREITASTGLNEYVKGWTLEDIVSSRFDDICKFLKILDEETAFILYLEWDALRSASAQFLGIDHDAIDRQRCQITSIESNEDGTEVAQVILPPQSMPKILPCSLGDN